ncbi:MAG: hypothetical protein ACTSPA_01115 [Promethearchaeota archaeon]
MSVDDIIKLGIKILKDSTDEDFEDTALQIAIVTSEEKIFKLLSEEEVKKYL